MKKIKITEAQFIKLLIQASNYSKVIYVTNEKIAELRKICLEMNEDQTVKYLLNEFQKSDYGKF